MLGLPYFLPCIWNHLPNILVQTKTISGITIDRKEHKIACYAENIILFLVDPENSIPELMHSLDTIGPISCYKLNKQKLFPIGEHPKILRRNTLVNGTPNPLDT